MTGFVDRLHSGEFPIAVRYTFSAAAADATEEEIVREACRLDAAVREGRYEPLVFNDFRWVRGGRVYTDPEHPDLKACGPGE